VRDPFDAKENIRGGTRYLRFLLNRFSGDLKFSLAAYNAGEKAVDAWGTVPPFKETRAYLRQIDLIYAARQQEATLSANAISRTIQGKQVIYTNLD
jgi:soluble lytic murein transglycosylase-like protein